MRSSITRDFEQLHRATVAISITLRRLAEHLGVPPATEKEIDRALEEEALAKRSFRRPVKSPTAATGQLSTGGPVVHRQRRAARPTGEEV